MTRRWLSRKKRETDSEASLARAQRSLERAQKLRAEQARKREQEDEGVIARMERLAEDNHLVGWVLEIVSGGNGGHR